MLKSKPLKLFGLIRLTKCRPRGGEALCLTHFLGDCIKPIKKADRKLRATLRQAMGPLPPVPGDKNCAQAGPLAASPVLSEPLPTDNLERANNEDAKSNKDETSHDGKNTLSASNSTTLDRHRGSSFYDEQATEIQPPNPQLASFRVDLAWAEDDSLASSEPETCKPANSCAFHICDSLPATQMAQNHSLSTADTNLSLHPYGVASTGSCDAQKSSVACTLASSLKQSTHDSIDQGSFISGYVHTDLICDEAFGESLEILATSCAASSKLADQTTYSLDCDWQERSIILTPHKIDDLATAIAFKKKILNSSKRVSRARGKIIQIMLQQKCTMANLS